MLIPLHDQVTCDKKCFLTSYRKIILIHELQGECLNNISINSIFSYLNGIGLFKLRFQGTIQNF